MWHIPLLFEAVLHNELVHTLQHLSFLLSALLFLVGPNSWIKRMDGSWRRSALRFHDLNSQRITWRVTHFFSCSLVPVYVGLTTSWGLSPIEDQQLGGLIMWIPAGLLYAIAGLALLAGWLRESETHVARREKVRALVRG